MGREQILEKLSIELGKDITEECQVVYILSRIRKILEIKNLKIEYKYLNFYCNWALHSELEKTNAMLEVFKEFVSGESMRFQNLDPLVSDLRNFLTEYELPLKIIDDHQNFLRFVNLLVEIYVDTPLYFKIEQKQKLTIQKSPDMKDKVFGFMYSIEIV